LAETVKSYTDEHVGAAVVDGLRRRGLDVLAAREADMLGASDSQHLAFALAQQRVLFTQDADFVRLHRAGVQHAGIVYAHQQTGVSEVLRGLVLVGIAMSPEEMANHLEYI